MYSRSLKHHTQSAGKNKHITPSTIKRTKSKSLSSPYNVQLTDIRKSDKPELVDITSKPHIMQFIGPGNIWSPSDVDKFINYTIHDSHIPTHKRMWFSYAIRLRHANTNTNTSTNTSTNTKLIGVIEFKCISIYYILPPNLRQKYKLDVAMTIYINDMYHGKGVAKLAIDQLKHKIRKLKPHARKIISLVKSSNHIMQKTMTKLGFVNSESIVTSINKHTVHNTYNTHITTSNRLSKSTPKLLIYTIDI